MSALEPESQSPEPAGGAGSGAQDRARVVKRLFEEHNRALVSFLNARLHSEQEARDVAQEAYVRLLQLDDHGAISFLRSYLFRIAANLAVDRLRERATREDAQPQELFEAIADERVPERVVIAAEELDLIHSVVLELPDKCRRAFVWHVFDGQSTTAIAAQLGVTDRMIRLYVAQGLALCRSRLDGARPKDGGERS